MKPLDPPRPISVGESLRFNEFHRRAAREVLARTPRYPGPPEKRSLTKLIGDLTNQGADLRQLIVNAYFSATAGDRRVLERRMLRKWGFDSIEVACLELLAKQEGAKPPSAPRLAALASWYRARQTRPTPS